MKVKKLIEKMIGTLIIIITSLQGRKIDWLCSMLGIRYGKTTFTRKNII